ncbi:hypothetical protein M5689_018008 [Euphorbia peplus]|nr:hypothetical protein M5689_018008 [Euphorbia peplus]
MPRSSRHKSSKHRDARDYSDSEKDSKDNRKSSRDESGVKVSKEPGSGEKRKLDLKESKESFASGNGEYVEEYLGSKRRKERVDSGNDRWNGGGDDDRGEGGKKLKEKSSESKSKRRDECAGAYVDSDDVVKKSSGKSDGKHRESSSRKETRDGAVERERDKEREREKEKEKERDRDRERERERDRRVKEGKNEKLIDVDDLHIVKQVTEKIELGARDLLQSPELDSLPDRRMRKKRDGSGDGDKRHDDLGDSNDKRLSSREDVSRDGRPKDEKHKDEKYRDKYREDVDRESRHRDDKQRDERIGKDHISNKSDDKSSRDDKDSVEIRLKKHKPQDGDRDRERDHDRDRERDRDRDRERDRERDHDRDWDWDRDRERERDRERNIDSDVLSVDDRNARYKDSRSRKRSPDDYDDYADAKSRGVKTAFLDMEKRPMSNSRVESDVDRGRSQSRQVHADNNAGGSRRRTSPNPSSLGPADDHRQLKQEDLKYKDGGMEYRSSKSMSSRDVTSTAGASERNSKYRPSEKHSKMDDGHAGEMSIERSSNPKASPMRLVDRSPSSNSLERRYANRSGVRRNLDIEESGRRSNAPMGSRDLPSADDRPNRDLPPEKSLMDDSTSVDSSFYNRTSQSNSNLIPPSAFRGGVSSPSFMSSMEEDGRMNVGSRYKRSGDSNLGRGQANAWRGGPWSSPLPNGYIPFQHGPPHGAFQAMLPQFPSPPLFGVRPSMEINHSGIPYHISDADRFASHMRPLGWQNMMDGSGPSHMHGWDGNNGVFRDESHMYGGPDWDQTRHSMNGRGWEGNADIWKGPNGDMNLELPSPSLKEDFPVQAPSEDDSSSQGGQRSQKEGNHLRVQEKSVETKITPSPSANDSFKSSPKTTLEKTPDPLKSVTNENVCPYDAYLSQLDISTELADPELYGQFVSLLNIKQSATAKEDTAMLVNLKDGARAVPKNSSILLSSSLFPATSDSIFQRAMGMYKKQRASLGGLPFANGGIIDFILESKMEEDVPPKNNMDIAAEEEPVANHDDEIFDVNSNEMKVEETIANVAVPEVSEVTPIMETGVDVNAPEMKLQSSDEGPTHDTPDKEKPMIEETIPSNPVNSADNNDKGDIVSSPCDVPNTTDVDTTEVEECKTDEIVMKPEDEKGSNTLNSGEEEEQGYDDGKCVPLILTDGTSTPGSNESESVILSRIHHSPESTH